MTFGDPMIVSRLLTDACTLSAITEIGDCSRHLLEASRPSKSSLDRRNELTAARKNLDEAISNLRQIRDAIDPYLEEPRELRPPQIPGMRDWAQERAARPFDPAPSLITDNDGRVALHSISSDEEPDIVTPNQAAS